MNQEPLPNLPELAAIKELISAIPMSALEEHCQQYDQVHLQLSKILSEVDGL
jgi:hypothetical protein